jgi:dihydropteroate synthase
MEERVGATIASNVLALVEGASVFRVHDVAAHRQALRVAETILRRRGWQRSQPLSDP